MSAERGTKLLKCEVRRGMFSDELVVSVRRRDGETESFFVPKDEVVQRRGDSFVKVSIAPAGSPFLVIASIPTNEPSTIVAVRPEDIE